MGNEQLAMKNAQLAISNETPTCIGWYWCQVNVVNNGLPDMAKVHIDEFDRMTAQFCGAEREFAAEELDGAMWAGPLETPLGLLDFLDDIPF